MTFTWDILKKGINPIIDGAVQEIFTKLYSDNLFLMVPVVQKETLRSIVEAALRAERGTELTRPLGSPNYLSSWNKILLNPRQLFQIPPEDYTKIETKTVIGPRAKKPLELDIPIMISAMSNGGSLSEQMKIALAKGASLAGTATNTGESTLVYSEREAAKYLIGQYNRGGWLSKPEQLKRVNAIEVQLGQGAWGGATDDVQPASEVTDYQKRIWNVPDGKDAVIHSRMPGINSTQDIIDLINKLKSEYDVPVGIKIAATHFIEKELEIIAQTDADFITIDGSEGGTSSSYPTLQDSVGFPTLLGLARAVNWLEDNNLKSKYNLIITGGLKEPGDFLRALALGADAVYIATIAIMASLQTQVVKAVPESVPVQLSLAQGKLIDKLDIDESANNLANFLKSSVIEMQHATQAVGKTSFRNLNKEDLVTVDKELAAILRIAYAGNPCI